MILGSISLFILVYHDYKRTQINEQICHTPKEIMVNGTTIFLLQYLERQQNEPQNPAKTFETEQRGMCAREYAPFTLPPLPCP